MKFIRTIGGTARAAAWLAAIIAAIGARAASDGPGSGPGGLPECAPGGSAAAQRVCAAERLHVPAALQLAARRSAARALPADLLAAWQSNWEQRIRDRCEDDNCLRRAYRDHMVDLRQPCGLAAEATPTEASAVAAAGELLGRVCGADSPDGEDCVSGERLRDAGLPAQLPLGDPTLAGWMSAGSVSASLLDIDNDGVPELVLATASGEAACERVLAFRPGGGSWQRLGGPGWAELAGTADRCVHELRIAELHGYHYLLTPQDGGSAVRLGLDNALYRMCQPGEPPAAAPNGGAHLPPAADAVAADAVAADEDAASGESARGDGAPGAGASGDDSLPSEARAPGDGGAAEEDTAGAREAPDAVRVPPAGMPAPAR